MSQVNRIIAGCAAVVLALVETPFRAESAPSPRGVILVVIDDIGYGDIDVLYPSSLETPHIDLLHEQSLRLTDFHVGSTCSPSRASLMTGRSVNAGGVWHTIAGREVLREDEQTMAEVFQANGWKTGIFGKWHLGEGYPFSARFRGFDVSVVHGGGGVGQGPDYWRNDYYSGVDQNGKPTRADVYRHNVPCFLRWKNGGIGGSTASARDVASLTAGMDLLPTLMDFFGLDKPDGGRSLHGVSLKEMLLNPNHIPTERTIVVDTQREADFNKWTRACVMRDEVSGGNITHKWRLIRESPASEPELYDFLVDRDTDNNVAAGNAATVATLSEGYESWWADVSPGREAYPAFVLNDDQESELTLFAHSWIGGDDSPWDQGHVRNASGGTGTHAVRFDRAGRYRFELRRWPREDGGAIDGKNSLGEGKMIPAKKARVTIAGIGEVTRAIKPGDASAVIEMDLPAGEPTTLVTAFLDDRDKVLTGAYYVHIKRVVEATETDGDGNAARQGRNQSHPSHEVNPKRKRRGQVGGAQTLGIYSARQETRR